MTTLDALDLAAAALRECRALKSDLEYKNVLLRAHDRIQHLRDLELRHGTLVVPRDTNGGAKLPLSPDFAAAPPLTP